MGSQANKTVQQEIKSMVSKTVGLLFLLISPFFGAATCVLMTLFALWEEGFEDIGQEIIRSIYNGWEKGEWLR